MVRGCDRDANALRSSCWFDPVDVTLRPAAAMLCVELRLASEAERPNVLGKAKLENEGIMAVFDGATIRQAGRTTLRDTRPDVGNAAE
jgi:hypothetical protein